MCVSLSTLNWHIVVWAGVRVWTANKYDTRRGVSPCAGSWMPLLGESSARWHGKATSVSTSSHSVSGNDAKLRAMFQKHGACEDRTRRQHERSHSVTRCRMRSFAVKQMRNEWIGDCRRQRDWFKWHVSFFVRSHFTPTCHLVVRFTKCSYICQMYRCSKFTGELRRPGRVPRLPSCLVVNFRDLSVHPKYKMCF